MHASDTEEGAPPEPTPGLRVLIADDEAMIRTTVRRLLERRGHQVDEAEDTPAAMVLLKDQAYDVLLADVHMPGNGRSLLNAALEQSFGGRIILMTGSLPDEVMPDPPEGVTLVKKPFDFDGLMRQVEEGLESRS